MAFEVAHPGAAGIVCLVLAILATLVAGFFLAGAITSLLQGLRGKGWSWGLDAGASAFGVVCIGASVGLWYLTIRYLPDTARFVMGAGRVLLVALLVLGMLGAGLAAVAHFAEAKRARGAGLAILAILFGLGLVVRFAGVDSLANVPRFLTAAASALAAIPPGVWAGTLASTFLLGMVLRGGFGLMLARASSGAGVLDPSHRWTDYRGQSYAQATRQEVYEHYHGRGSWYAMMRTWSAVSSVTGFLLPVLAPLGVVHWSGWLDVWSRAGIALAMSLGVASLGAAFLLARLRR